MNTYSTNVEKWAVTCKDVGNAVRRRCPRPMETRAAIQAWNISTARCCGPGPKAEKRFIIPPKAPDGNQVPVGFVLGGLRLAQAGLTCRDVFCNDPKKQTRPADGCRSSQAAPYILPGVFLLLLLLYFCMDFFPFPIFPPKRKKNGLDGCAEP